MDTKVFTSLKIVENCLKEADDFNDDVEQGILDIIYDYTKPNYKLPLLDTIKINDKFSENAYNLVSYYRKDEECRTKYPNVDKFCKEIETKYKKEFENESIIVDYCYNEGILAYSRLLYNYLEYDYDKEFYDMYYDYDYCECNTDDESDYECNCNNYKDIRKLEIEQGKEEYPMLDT